MKDINQKELPIAYLRPSQKAVDKDTLRLLISSYAGRSVASCYQGPSWLTEDGVATIVIIARDAKWISHIRDQKRGALIAWLWNTTPSMYFSLTLMASQRGPDPCPRWFGAESDPITKAIREFGRFFVVIACLDGQHSGIYEATFRIGGEKSPPSRQALEYLASFSASGIPYSHTDEPFDPLRREGFDDDSRNEIPLWPEKVSDFWKTIKYDGPWASDRDAIDNVMATWGKQAWHNRQRAAGHLQLILDRRKYSGAAIRFSESGELPVDSPLHKKVSQMICKYPLLGQWLAALDGPNANAKLAYDCAYAVLMDPQSLFAALEKCHEIIGEIDDEPLTLSFQSSFEAALIDARITGCGLKRPWLRNSDKYALSVEVMPIDVTAKIADIARLWHSGLEMIDLIDAGQHINPHDFPVALDDVCKALESVHVDGAIEDAEAVLQDLLFEAQEARQWSIPWGARVEVKFGPFVAVRIFENKGEFTCLFLDENDYYFHVAIGLGRKPIQIAARHIYRSLDDGTLSWNEDAEVSLKLIAAAIIRDFLVVEDRTSVFSSRSMRRRVRGRDIRTVIYLPRVRYSKPNLNGVSYLSNEEGRIRHAVSQHLRKTGKSSATQRLLAKRYGIYVPEGFTFVRPHERGGINLEERVRIYRSRSASRMIYDVVSRTPDGTRPAWFDFEKDCSQILLDRGMKVIHQSANRDGDGGIDLYAVDNDGGSYVVQCKCWSPDRPVGPDVIRELSGAMSLADKGSDKCSRGIVITTSSFTSGAISAAGELGFELIDGAKFSNLLCASTVKQT